VLNKGTTGTLIFIVFGMTRSWSGFDFGTSRTRNPYSTTRLSRLFVLGAKAKF